MFYLKESGAMQIKVGVDKGHRGSVPTLKIIYFWINCFKRGRTYTEVEGRPGCLIENTRKMVTAKFQDVIRKDHRVKVGEIAV